MRNSRGVVAAAVAAGLICVMGGCKRYVENSSRYIDLPEKGWAYNDTLAFPLGLPDSVAEGSLTVAVDHASDYHYRNLWIEVSGKSGEDNNQWRDTLQIVFSDSAGSWIGMGLASNYQIETEPLMRTIDTSSPIVVRHIMRTDTLRGINRVGVFFSVTKQ